MDKPANVNVDGASADDHVLSAETIAHHKKLAADLHNKVKLIDTLNALLAATKDGHFDDESLKGVLRDLAPFLRPPNEYSIYAHQIEDDTKIAVVTIVAQLAQHSHQNRAAIDESGIPGSSLLDLLTHSNPKVPQQVATLLHYLSRSQEVSSRIAKPWALNPLVSLFVSSDQMGVLDHLAACFANLIPLDNLNIIGTQEVIDRIAYLLKNGSDMGKEHAACFVCNYLARRDTVTYMILKSGIPDVLVHVLRQNLPQKAKKPLLAALVTLAEVSPEAQTNAVKLGVLGSISEIIHDTNQKLQELCLELVYVYAVNHDMNKMQILTAGFMDSLLGYSREFRADSRLAQRALRVLAVLSDCKMFPSVFGKQKLALFEDVLRCGDPPMVQCSVVVLLNISRTDPDFREAILSMGLVKHVKEYMVRLGEKASNPVFQDFVDEMERSHKVETPKAEKGGWFTSASNYLWTYGGALSAKLMAPQVPPEKWTVAEVCEWLKRYWYSQYCETFSKHLVNGALLLDLTDADLEDLGVTDKFHRRSILKQIEVLKSGTP